MSLKNRWWPLKGRLVLIRKEETILEYRREAPNDRMLTWLAPSIKRAPRIVVLGIQIKIHRWLAYSKIRSANYDQKEKLQMVRIVIYQLWCLNQWYLVVRGLWKSNKGLSSTKASSSVPHKYLMAPRLEDPKSMILRSRCTQVQEMSMHILTTQLQGWSNSTSA